MPQPPPPDAVAKGTRQGGSVSGRKALAQENPEPPLPPMPAPISEEAQFHLLRLLEHDPQASQRELSAALGISLGKTNYCLQALIRHGFVKARNFRNHQNKRVYAYLLTPSGIEEKARVTLRFLARKQREYAALKTEIAELEREAGTLESK
jgi:EPS-associated MarR family transcriptional regulator